MVIFRENSEDIRQANLAAGGLLGLERSKLSRRNFEFFIESRDIPVYRALLSRVFAGGAKETCELALAHKGKSRRFLRLEASADDTGQSRRVAMLDITELKQTEQTLRKMRRNPAPSSKARTTPSCC